MSERRKFFNFGIPAGWKPNWGDLFAVALLILFLYLAIQVALAAPRVVRGPQISLTPQALPVYAAYSLGRMLAAYALSMLFTLVYGRWAAYHRSAELILMPLLDVLQSVPILSFLPVFLLSLSAVLPQGLAIELASIALIFTSQAWNLTFAWYQSLTTIPKELREASSIYRFGSWMRFKSMELPFAAISLIWNSMMSWAGGWFFLMAAEYFTVGQRNFQLPGLGAYLHQAASNGNLQAIAWGLATLVLIIVALDQLIWRPLLAWSERFKLEMVGADQDREATSWFYDLIRSSDLLNRFQEHVTQPVGEAIDRYLIKRFPGSGEYPHTNPPRPWVYITIGGIGGLVFLYAADLVIGMLSGVTLAQWGQIGIGLLATLGRVLISLIIALAWTIPVGVAIGTNRRLAAILQPLVQITASVPATALFPAFLLLVINIPGGLNLAAIFLMLMGTQWYLLFNIIAGAAAIPQDLKYTARMLQLSRWQRWRTLILPALFPYIVTGGITASGGAWNASIVAEQVDFAGRTLSTTGIGAMIAQATGHGNYPLLLATTLTLVLSVILINRLVWRQLYVVAESQYRME